MTLVLGQNFRVDEVPRERQAVADACASGLVINLSGNNLDHADKLATLGIAPVVAVVPSDTTENTTTPQGRKAARPQGGDLPGNNPR